MGITKGNIEANNNNDTISLIKRFANNLLQMQQQQTKLKLGFIIAINNDINFSNNYQNINNILNSESIINNDLIGGTTSNELNKNENNIHLNVMGYHNSNSSNNNSNHKS